MRCFIALGLLLLAAAVPAAEFGLRPSGQTDTVRFESTASLEFIEGRTTDLVGGFTFEPDNSKTEVSGVLRVDLRLLKTGIALRDRHMRERHLHTDKFPFAYFEVQAVSGLPAQLSVDTAYRAAVSGEFYIHGVRRAIVADATVTRRNHADRTVSLQIDATLPIRLDDFDIDRPRALFLKLAEQVNVEVVFTAYDNVSHHDIELPDWPLLE